LLAWRLLCLAAMAPYRARSLQTMRQKMTIRRAVCAAILASIALTLAIGPCGAATWPPTPFVFPGVAPAPPGSLCRAAVKAAEAGTDLPPNRLIAIALTESGRADPATGHVDPWPWSINVEGQDHIFESKADAVAAVRALQAKGTKSIDVGCMQINILYHPDAFATLEQAFDPRANAGYAVAFLDDLRQRTGSWDAATAAYHSATPELGEPYRARVMRMEQAEARAPAAPMTPAAPGALLRFAAAGGGSSVGASLPRGLPAGTGAAPPMWGGAGGPVEGQRGGGAQALAAMAVPRGGTGHGLDFYRRRSPSR
jgi:hypothetical protein